MSGFEREPAMPETARDEVQMMAAGAASRFFDRLPALVMAEVLDSLMSSPELLARLAIGADAFVRSGVHCRGCGHRTTMEARCGSCGRSEVVTLYAVAGDG